MLDENTKIVLYGMGKRCRLLLQLISKTSSQVVDIVDTNADMWGQKYKDYVIHSPEVISQYKNVVVCITFFSHLEEEPIWTEVKEHYGLDDSEVYSFHALLIEIYKRLLNSISFDVIPTSETWKYCFDTTWIQGMGGVESWLRDLKESFLLNGIDAYWLRFEDSGKYESDYLQFKPEHVINGISLLLHKMPCVLVLSTVDELMLSAYLLKKTFPEKIRIIMTVHNSCDGMYKDILSYREMIDYYVCVSSAMRNDLISEGIAEEKIAVMTIPVEKGKNRHEEISAGKTAPIRLGYAGRLEIKQKRIDILLELANELNERDLDFILSIAGEGDIENDINDYIRRHNLSQKVKLLGRIEKAEIPAFWAKQDIGINTSDFEGRSLSIMESMIAGAVPVVTDTKGVFDDVVDGVNGYIVEKGDYKTMADRIIELSKNPDMLKRMSKRAREDMLEKSNMDKHVEFWKEVLEMKS